MSARAAQHGRGRRLAIRLALAWLLLAGATISAAVVGAVPDDEARAAALALWNEGRREEAVARLAELLAELPDDLPLRRELAERQLAIHLYEGALATAGERPELSDVAGRALFVLGRPAEALAHLSSDERSQVVLVVEAHAMLGQVEETWAALRRAEELLGTEHPQLLAQRGLLLAGDGRHAEALAAYEDALAADPLHAGALYGKGQALLRLGRRDEGLAVMESHRRLVPLLDRLDFARRALDLLPLHAGHHAQLGDVERELGRLDAAEACYREAAALADRHERAPVALRHARLLAEDRADVDGALAVLAEAFAASSDVRLLVRGGDLLREAGRAGEALALFEQAQTLRPQDEQIAARVAAARAEAAAGAGAPGTEGGPETPAGGAPP